MRAFKAGINGFKSELKWPKLWPKDADSYFPTMKMWQPSLKNVTAARLEFEKQALEMQHTKTGPKISFDAVVFEHLKEITATHSRHLRLFNKMFVPSFLTMSVAIASGVIGFFNPFIAFPLCYAAQIIKRIVCVKDSKQDLRLTTIIANELTPTKEPKDEKESEFNRVSKNVTFLSAEQFTVEITISVEYDGPAMKFEDVTEHLKGCAREVINGRRYEEMLHYENSIAGEIEALLMFRFPDSKIILVSMSTPRRVIVSDLPGMLR